VTETIEDEFLLEQARNRDQDAFLLLYERHGSPIFRFLYRLLGSADIAEAITHDCFLSLIRGPEASNSSAQRSLLTRLYSTARTLAVEYSRNADQEAVVKYALNDDVISSSNPPSKEPKEGTLVSEVEEAIATLPLLEREVLILSEYEGIKLDEIAAVVEADVGTVAARLGSARQRLRNILAPLL
jgi:RNA polymerase sigma factor (sigma-70 family)